MRDFVDLSTSFEVTFLFIQLNSMAKILLKKIIVASFISIAILFSFSCKSTSKIEKVNVVDLLEPDFDVYFSIPVQENFEFSKKLVSSFLLNGDEDSEKDVEKIVKRIDFLYVGLNLDSKEYEISASGDFPTTLSKLVLTEKKGWKKEKYSSYVYRTHSASGVNLSMINPDIAVLSSNSKKIETQLSRYNSIIAGENLERIDFQTSDKDIIFYFPDGNKAFSLFIPVDIKLGGVKSFKGVLSNSSKPEVFDLNVFIDSTDTRMLKATSVLLRLGLMGTPAQIIVENDVLTISNLNLDWNSIIDLAKSSSSK